MAIITNRVNLEKSANQLFLMEGVMELARTKEVEDYQAKYKPDYQLELTPTKTVVVYQDPKAGATVPQGTEVTVVMGSKPTLPVDIFVLDQSIANTYKEQQVGKVILDIEEKGGATKAILEQKKEYEQLNNDEKRVVTEYATQNLGYTGGQENVKQVYEDLNFLYNF